MSYSNPSIPQINAPANIDRIIQEIQLNLSLKLSWLSNSFGRSYRGVTKRSHDKKAYYYPEVYKGNGEYYPVSFNDNLDAMCFFELDSETDAGEFESNTHNYIEADLNIVFWVNLKKIDSDLGNNYRFTEVLKRDVREVLTRQTSGLGGQITINNVNNDPDEIFRKYSFRQEEKQYFKFPFAAFAFDCSISFQEDCNPDLSDTFCDTLRNHLTANEKNVCLLPSYDFSDDNVFNNLTPQQISDLQSRICTP